MSMANELEIAALRQNVGRYRVMRESCVDKRMLDTSAVLMTEARKVA